MYKKTIINENDKEVTFGVVSLLDTEGQLKLVVLSAESKDSSADWKITRNEADVLHELLGEYLSTE